MRSEITAADNAGPGVQHSGRDANTPTGCPSRWKSLLDCYVLARPKSLLADEVRRGNRRNRI